MRALYVAAATFAAAAAVPSAAAPTIGNTGIDSNWKVAFLGDTATAPTNAQASATGGLGNAIVVTSTVNNWIAGNTVSKWVSASADASSQPGYYAYSNTFTASVADVLNFDYAVDDKIRRVLLNGNVVTGFSGGTYTSFTSGSVSGLSAGLNTLTFLISNNFPGQDANINPSGFRFQTTAAVPEPGTWMMMIGGFGMIGLTMRSRRPALKKAIG